jgi:hypothetical protein
MATVDVLMEVRGRHQEAVMPVVTQTKPTDTVGARSAPAASQASIELYWLPLARVAGLFG